jgi:sec-independent protein translocase protein TatA
MVIVTPPQGSVMPALFAFDLSFSTMLIIGVLAVLLFGERLPEVARTVGKGLTEFKRGIRSIQDEVEGAINSSTLDSTDTASRHKEPEEREEATAPKFEPPPSS